MSRAIENLLADGEPTAPAVEAFVKRHEFPVVEGTRVTFVYVGEADEVRLRHFIFGLPSSQPLVRAGSSDLWHLTMEIPAESRIEYKFEHVRGSARKWLMDPLNPHVARDPYGANSVCHGEGYVPPAFARPDPEARPGVVEPAGIRSEVFSGDFGFRVYRPARFRPNRRYPLLVVHDGDDYLRYSSLKTVLDNLIHRLEIPPLVAALISSNNRLVEYAADPRHGRFLVEELLPALERAYPLRPAPRWRCLMGASFGAVATLSTAWNHPGVFGRLLLQSGSFAFSDIGGHERGEVFDPVVSFVNEFRAAPGKPAEKVFVSCGMYESLIYENRSLLPLLQSTGMQVRYVEARDGHNWENWRDRLREGLSWLFPGPLWMVYE